MVERLAHWEVTIDHTDRWGTYAAVLPPEKLVMRKTGTGHIERNHCRQRHGLGRFKRKSIIVSKSQEMVDLTMALLAKFWVNGRVNPDLWYPVPPMTGGHRHGNITVCRPPEPPH